MSERLRPRHRQLRSTTIARRARLMPSSDTERSSKRPQEVCAPRSPAPNRQRAHFRPLLIATRPRQWMKNLLVFAAPGTAGLLGRPAILGRTALAAGVFLIASAGTYLLNDAIDAPSDRVHPEKRHRPVAARELSATLAIAVGIALLVLAVVAASFLGGMLLACVIGAYVVTSVTYTLWLKQVAVIEIACISAGFVLRAVAGGAAVHISISPWFAIVTSSAALLVVAGKRSAEIDLLGRAGGYHRKVLERYTKPYLRSIRLIASSVAIMSFSLWAFERAAHIAVGHADADDVLFQLAILPFVLGVLSVELAFESGEGGAPEELVLHNRVIQVLALSCLARVAFGIYT